MVQLGDFSLCEKFLYPQPLETVHYYYYYLALDIIKLMIASD
jgi:hypothetical protein